MEAILTDTHVSGQLFLRHFHQTTFQLPYKFCIFTFPKEDNSCGRPRTVYEFTSWLVVGFCELHFSFVFKLPQISFASESCILIYQLHIAVRHNEFISVSVFVCLFVCFFTYTSGFTSKHHVNFMLVTELQHFQNNRIAKQ